MLSLSAVLHLLPYLGSAAVSAGVGAYCWARRARPGVGAFAVMALAQAAWTLGLVFETAAPTLGGKLFWDDLQFLPIPVIPTAFLAFAHRYGGRRIPHAPVVYAGVAAPLAALAVLAFTDPLHGWVRIAPRLVPGTPFAELTYGFTPLFTAAYAWLVVVYLAAFAELAAAWARAHPLYRAQLAVLAAGAAIPLLGAGLTLTVLADAPGRDITPLTFAVSQLVIAWGLFRRHLFDVVPVARHAVVESLSDAVWVIDAEGRVVDLNPAARRASDDGGAEPVGRAGEEVIPLSAETVRRLADTRGEHVEVETTAGGGVAELGVHPVNGPRGEPWGRVLVLRDIRERKQAEQELRLHRDRLEELVTERTEQLQHGALHDALTGLPNRVLFQDRLRHALDLFHRHPDRGFAVMVVDLDRFKRVNDSFGHLAGDRLLAAAADRLRAGMRDGDTVARFGGDEFALLMEDVPGAGEALRAAGHVQAALAAPFTLEGHELFVTASLGIALSEPDTEPDELVRKADTALYRAKELGGGQCEVFDRAMHARALARLRLETELRHAAERGEFAVVYQPIVALDDGRVAGFEALVRWHHPARGVLAPGSFLDVAEETGLVVHIDRWVLREACIQLRRWRALHPEIELRVTVNVSARQFTQGGLVEHLEATLAETGVDVDWIRLEITEGVLVGRAEEAVLAELRARGVHLLIDDFGTGHSSLGYLHRLPISALKVDRSFMSGSEGNFAIVGAVVTLAHHLGMDVVVEGVERPEQLERVRGIAADYAQGYLFSRPLDASAAEALLLRRWTGDGWSPALVPAEPEAHLA
jgi:diguanylate cyclase (GGDEF)-like protein/PAS domain S-box-containing protein